MTSETDEDVFPARPDPRRRLGRGLSALFDDEEDDTFAAAGNGGVSGTASGSRQVVGIDQLEPGPYQPRRAMDHDALQELAESIAAHGILQPILARPRKAPGTGYEIIAGERRWRAAQLAQLHEVPVVIREISDLEALEFGLIENLQRRDLNPLEEAAGYRQLMNEFGHTQEKISAGLGKSRSHVANMIRLLTLPESVQEYIRQGKLTAGHARALITTDNPEEIAKAIVAQGLSVRDVERLAGAERKSTAKAKGVRAGGKSKDVDMISLEKEMTNILGMKVEIRMKGGAAGQLQVSFKTLDQLEDVLQRLSVTPGRGHR